MLADLQTGVVNARNALENTKAQLRLSQRSVAQLTKTLGSGAHHWIVWMLGWCMSHVTYQRFNFPNLNLTDDPPSWPHVIPSKRRVVSSWHGSPSASGWVATKITIDTDDFICRTCRTTVTVAG